MAYRYRQVTSAQMQMLWQYSGDWVKYNYNKSDTYNEDAPLFNRITRNPNKFGGQPYIANTNITVQQVVNASLQGHSIEQIMQQFSSLTIDDIHQALSFSIQDIVEGVAHWRHDGITPLTQVKGYSEILIGKTDFGDLDAIPESQKQQWLSIIYTSNQRGLACWQQMRHWLNTQYIPTDNKPPMNTLLEHFIQDVVKTTQDYEPTITFDNQSKHKQHAIMTHSQMSAVLGSVLAYAKNMLQPEITISTQQQDQQLLLTFDRALTYPSDDISKLSDAPYTPFATAFMFFSMLQLGFTVEKHNASVRYYLTLPINL